MFYYMFLPLEQHFDSGLGAMGESFKRAADRLDAGDDNGGTLSNAHLPICFLYRHAIELYLKSAIMVLHRRFQLPGSDDKHNSMPTILMDTQGTTRPIHAVHSVEKLALFSDAQRRYCKPIFDKMSSAIAEFPPEFFRDIRIVEAHDSSSTYFRYPVTTKSQEDAAKSAMQPITLEKLKERMEKDPTKVMSFIFVDDDGNAVEAFHHDQSAIQEAFETLRRLADVLSSIHVGIRMEFSGGH